MMREVERILVRYPEAALTPVWTHSAEPSVCDPNPKALAAVAASMVRILAEAQANLAAIRATEL